MLEILSNSPEDTVRVQKIISHLVELITRWKNGDPGEIKHSISRDSQWKVRKAWFSAVAMRLEFLCILAARGIVRLATDLEQEIRSHLATITTVEFSQRLTQPDDITKLEAIVEKVIAGLSGELSREYIKRVIQAKNQENLVPPDRLGSSEELAA